MISRLRGYFLLVLILSMLARPVSAQSGLTAQLSAPNSDAFPKIEAYLDVKDAQGAFVHDLQPDQVSVLEGENTLPIDEIEELRPGVQVVVAINPGPAFAIRNFQAVSRYDLVKEALGNWAKSRQGTTTDDWSLLITGGTSVSHSPDPAKFLDGLASDQVDDRTAQPSIDTLARAVTLASDPVPRPGMGRVVLFVTTSIEGEFDQALKDISDQARQQNVIIHIWMVASSGALITQSAQELMSLSSATGGQVFTFSGEEALPDPETILDSMRYVYRIAYQSRVGLSGEHEFATQVRVGEEQVQSNNLNFQVDLQPPEPAFVSPPIEIDRKLPIQPQSSKNGALADVKSSLDLLSPKEVTLQVVFDFPDGRKRELASSALLVDGAVVAENQSPPFDQFVWKLEGYSSNGDHQLQVQAKDVLGMTGASIEVPVKIMVERPETDPWFVVRSNLLAISVLLALVAGGLLFLILVLGGRLHPSTQRAANLLSHKQPARAPVLTQGEPPGRRLTGWVSRLQHPHHPDAPNAIAYLRRVAEADSDEEGLPIPITSDEVLLGSDPAQASLVLDDACIEGLHARLIHEADGSFRLADQGSIAGTWVNYTPVDRQGAPLQNGDLVHFGRIGFRFTVRKPAQVLKPSVILETPPAQSRADPVGSEDGAADPGEETGEEETEEPAP